MIINLSKIDFANTGGGGSASLQEKNYNITQNGDTVISPDEGFGGISGGTINVNVPIPTPKLQEKVYEITQNGDTPISPDSGFDGISGGTISVNVTNPPTAYDINSPFVSLAYYTGTSVPSEIVGWETLTNGNSKCANSRLSEYKGNLILDLPNLINGNGLFYDALNNYASFSGNLDKLEIGGGVAESFGMFAQSNITSFNSNLPSLTDGRYMFSSCTALTSWNIELPKLTSGSYMFSDCSGLTSFTSDLSSLTNGASMFSGCSKLTSWNIELPKLTSGSYMFYGCRSLTSFTSDLSSLTSGESMFSSCKALTSWNIELPKLTSGSYMFIGCSNLTSFTSDLSSLTSGESMFDGCNSLTSFTSDLSSLTNGRYIFYSCKGLTNVTLSGTLNCNNLSFSASTALTVDSMVNIISVLVDRTDQSSYTLNLGSTNLAKLTDEQKAVATNKNWVLS